MSVSRPRPVIPEGLPELLHSLSFSVIKERPKDIISFAADHFSQLFEEREQERRELAEKAKNIKEDYFEDADSYAWRANYYDPEEWQVMPDLKLPKGSLYEKYGEQFRLVEDDEEDRKRRSLEAKTKIEGMGPRETISCQTEEIVNETTSVQTSDEEKCPENEESSSYEITGESNSPLITTESSNDQTSNEPIHIKTEDSEKEESNNSLTNDSEKEESNNSLTNDTEELSSNPDSETVSLGSSENLSTDD